MMGLEELDEALQAPRALLFKHSPACWISARAARQVERFASTQPDTPVYVIDVIAHRDVSRHIAERLGIRHMSPQVILLREGIPAWNADHFGVTARAIARETGRTRTNTE